MTKGRLEAFSDGVIAIIITVMVLELKVPQGTDLEALRPVLPALLSYVLSFVFIGIYWNNHHHIFHAVQRVSGMTLWANLHLLFWLSLVPYVTEWMGQSHFGAWPTAVYGLVLLLCAIAWDIERRVLLRNHDSRIRTGEGAGRQPQGMGVGGDLRAGHRPGVRQHLGFVRPVLSGRRDLVRSGSPD